MHLLDRREQEFRVIYWEFIYQSVFTCFHLCARADNTAFSVYLSESMLYYIIACTKLYFTHTCTQTDANTHTLSYLKCLQPAIFHILQQPAHLSQPHSVSCTMHKHQMHQLLQCIGWNTQAPSCNWNTQHTYISTSSTQFAKHQHSFRRWFCSPWTPHTAFHNFCTSPGDRHLCACNKNWTMEQIKNLNNIQQLQIFTHTNTEIFIPYPSFHKDNGPLSSGNNNLNKSTSNSPAANSVHLYAHLHCSPVTIISTQCYKRPTLTQEHLEALWPIDTRKL